MHLFRYVLILVILLQTQFHGKARQLDSLLELYSTSSQENKAEISRQIASQYYFRDSVGLAFEYANESIILAEEAGDYQNMAKSLNLLGYIYIYWDNYEHSLDAFLSAERLSREFGFESDLVVALHGIARNYAYLGNLDEAMEVNRQGLEISVENGWRKQIAGFCNNAAEVFSNKEEYDSSLVYFLRYHDISESLGDHRSMIYALNNIGEVYSKLGDFPLAMHFLERANKINDTISDAQARIAIRGNMAIIQKGQGNLRKALELFEESNTMAMEYGMQRFAVANYREISQIYEDLGDYKKALEFYRRSSALEESLTGEEAQLEVNELIRKYEQAELERRDELFLQKHRSQRHLLYLSIALFILALVIIVLLVIAYRLRIRLHKERSEELTETVDKRNRELTSALMYNSQLRNVFDQARVIVSRINKGDKNNAELSGEISDLNKLMQSHNSSEEEWETIQMHFNEVHPEYFKKLSELGPDLTQYDLKHCAYIKMNLSTKEISRILNISDRSVQTARYRIKKKLGLDPDQDLIQFLLNI